MLQNPSMHDGSSSSSLHNILHAVLLNCIRPIQHISPMQVAVNGSLQGEALSDHSLHICKAETHKKSQSGTRLNKMAKSKRTMES